MGTRMMILLLFLSSNLTYGQIRDLMFAPYKENRKWGYINNDLDTICQAKYDRCYPFTNGRGRVKKKKKYGFVDYRGKLVVRAVYDHARPFRYGVATVRKGKRTFRITTDGRRHKGAIEIRGRGGIRDDYVNARDISENVIRLNDKYGLRFRYSTRGDIDAIYLYDTLNVVFDSIFTLGYEAIAVKKNGKYAIIDCESFLWGSKYVFDRLDFQFDDLKLFTKRRFQHKIIGIKMDGLWGYFDVYSGSMLIEPKYLGIEEFDDHLARVEYKEGSKGYINTFGMEFFEDPGMPDARPVNVEMTQDTKH